VLFNLRYNPNWSAERLEAECEAVLRVHRLEYAVAWHRGGEPFFTPEGALRSAAREALTAFAGAAPEESTGGGTSDARFIAPLGAQCIEIGPVNASIHKVDEHVCATDLEKLPDLYQALLVRLLVGS
jgi:succinyl-diaminopimelate desuccinylase